MEQKEIKNLLSWNAPEFVYYPKTRTWFAVLGIITVGFFITAILMKNYFFALLIPIAAFLIYIHAQKQPRRITIKITTESVHIGEHQSFNHKDITSFWIIEEPEIRILSLETKKPLQPKITILLEDQEAAAVKEALKNFIKEKKHEESFADIIAKRLRF
jgi:hypothetical protein